MMCHKPSVEAFEQPGDFIFIALNGNFMVRQLAAFMSVQITSTIGTLL